MECVMGGSVGSAGKFLNKLVVGGWWIRKRRGRRTKDISIFRERLFKLDILFVFFM